MLLLPVNAELHMEPMLLQQHRRELSGSCFGVPGEALLVLEGCDGTAFEGDLRRYSEPCV